MTPNIARADELYGHKSQTGNVFGDQVPEEEREVNVKVPGMDSYNSKIVNDFLNNIKKTNVANAEPKEENGITTKFKPNSAYTN